MKNTSLWGYIIGVIIVLIIANWVAFMVGGKAKLQKVEIFSAGYLVGMTAMHTAMHVYKWS